MLRFIFRTLVLLAVASAATHAQWVQTNVLGVRSVFSFAVSNFNVFAGTDSGIYASTDGGLNWQLAPDTGLAFTYYYGGKAYPYPVNALVANDSFAFAGVGGTGVFRSTDYGATWRPVNSGLANLFITSLAATDSHLFTSTSQGVFRSSDGGNSWHAASAGITDPYLNCLAVSPGGTAGWNIVAGAVDIGSTRYRGGLFFSANDGTSWRSISSGLPDSSMGSVLLVPGAQGGFSIFAGTRTAGLFVSADTGTTWQAANIGLNSADVEALAVGNGGSILYAGVYGVSSGGVFVSFDLGETWKNTGFPYTKVNALARSASYLFAGANNAGSGVWRSGGNPVSVKEEHKNIPSGYALEQNYPNPFNPTTTIKYALSEETRMELKVFSVFGQEVRTLVSERQSAGYKWVIFDASDLASGVYFYRLQAGQYTAVKKMLLVR